jgi:hypothetical protein
MQIPFFSHIHNGERFLLAGCGGGYDIVAAIPLYLYLRQQGKTVILANLSFTRLEFTDCSEVIPGCYRIEESSDGVPYFPEKFIYEWLSLRGESPTIYAFANTLGVQSLRRAYEYLREQYQIDTVVLADGGTDSLMFGDEVGTGTIVEDSLSILAAAQAGFARSYLCAVGFGVEYHHGLDHYPCLQNIATLTKAGAYLGAHSLTVEMAEGTAYLALADFLNTRFSQHQSIVVNSIVSAMCGEFGDFHSTARTRGSEQFINPLMPLYWYFQLSVIAERVVYRDAVMPSETMTEFLAAFRDYRDSHPRRGGRRDLPI